MSRMPSLLIPSLCLLFGGCMGHQAALPAQPANPVREGPFFLVSPADQKVRAGEPATFTCLATGPDSLAYQWYRNNVPIHGAQSQQYRVAAATLEEDGAQFRVAATSGDQVAWSFPATLSVRIWLAQMAIDALQAQLPDGSAILPGQRLSLVISAVQPAGPVLVTEGRGKGLVGWDNFAFQATGVQVDASGNVSLPEDPRSSDGMLPHLRAELVGRRDLAAELDVPVRYDGAFLSDHSGDPGAPGGNGLDGMSGFPGSPGSCDPNDLQAGGNGSDGWSGGPGWDGAPGAAGPDLQVWVGLRSGAHPLLQVKAVSPGRTQFFLVDPQGGSLLLRADGGQGGTGGRGGRGGAGGSGGSGCPDGANGLAGSDGSSGLDGRGGRGGSITVRVDPAARSYLSALRFSNKGGWPAGENGPPVAILVETVDPLW